MSTVTGSFKYTIDGVASESKFTDLPYAKFAVAQALIIALLQQTALWGMAGALGVDPPGPDADGSAGDAEYSYVADFAGGGYSEGHNEWHGIPAGASAAIGASLAQAAGYLS